MYNVDEQSRNRQKFVANKYLRHVQVIVWKFDEKPLHWIKSQELENEDQWHHANAWVPGLCMACDSHQIGGKEGYGDLLVWRISLLTWPGHLFQFLAEIPWSVFLVHFLLNMGWSSIYCAEFWLMLSTFSVLLWQFCWNLALHWFFSLYFSANSVVKSDLSCSRYEIKVAQQVLPHSLLSLRKFHRLWSMLQLHRSELLTKQF